METFNKITVGVDVSKNKLDIYLYPTKKHFIIKNNNSGFRELIQELKLYDVKQIICESSGGYENRFLRVMDKKGYKTWQIEPKRIKAFAISEGIKAKTDALDSKIIAMFGHQKSGRFKPKCTNSKKMIELRAFVDRKLDLTFEIANEKKRLQQVDDGFCLKQITNHINFMKKQIVKIEKKIEVLMQENSDWQKKSRIMQTIPGIGKATSNVLIAHMTELGTLTSKTAASLLGVAPYTKQSGKHVGIASIKGGRMVPRNAVYMAALTASRSNPILKEFYGKLISSGKKPKVALVAVMRKIIIIANAMLRDEKIWITQ